MNRIKLFVPVFLFLVMSVFLYLGLGKDPQELPSATLGKPLPSFELVTLDSGLKETFKSTELEGEAFLMNIWATWCRTCLVEHPYLYALSQSGVKIIGINYKDDSDKAVQWLEKYKNPYAVTVVDDKGRLSFDLGVTGAPETYLVNADGQIAYRHIGVVDEEVWEQHFKHAFSDVDVTMQ